ncbi:uncharacterized protein [Dendrobates tinctorius]|uniref:uncharacterized protein n=1 Tax=Dendrobates tinctorius TaxID=92724 RepID=UPI003CCA04CA
MGMEDPRTDRSVQDIMFGGLGQKKRRVFPLNKNVQGLIDKEWEKPDRKSSTVPSIKRKYPFDEEASTSWDKAPKLDVAVAKASRRFALPFEDMGTLKDPLDKKADTLLKGTWESAGGNIRPAVAATCTSRALMVWIDQLERQIREGVPRDKILESMPMIRGAAAFLADSSADSIRLSSKTAALSNAARRALWLKCWPGDLQTKMRLCAIPCEGKFLFGETLDDILEKAGDKKKGFPNLGPVSATGFKRSFRNKKFFQRRPPRDQKWEDRRRDRGFIFGNLSRDKKNPPSDCGPRVGGRLSFFLPAWEKISNNPWLINLVRSGLRINFYSLPPQKYIITPIRSSKNEQDALEKEVLSMLDKKVLQEVPPQERGRGFYLPLFLVTKPDGTFRTIINLKRLNCYIKNEKFKMESIKSTIKILFPQCFMVVLDLSDAYYHVPIHKESRQYLRLAVSIAGEIREFQYKALPFGISVAPRVFTKLVAEMMAHIREQDVLIVPYLDDFLIASNSGQKCTEQRDRVMSTLKNLGWLLNLKKSRLEPRRVQEFLGLTLDSNIQVCYLPDHKKDRIIHMVQKARQNPSMTLRRAMSLLGSLSACLPAVQWAQIHMRDLQWDILTNQRALGDHLEHHITLVSKTIHSLAWWEDKNNLSKGIPWEAKITHVITTDASPVGWGAHRGISVAQGGWRSQELKASSNQKELLAVNYALSHFLPALKGHHVRIFSDNRVTVAYINHQGGTRSRTLMEASSEIFRLAEENLLSLSALHIRGVENQTADFLSRTQLHQGELALNQSVFQKIVEMWGTPDIDLFADHKKQKSGSILFSKSQGESSDPGRIYAPMDTGTTVCLPTDHSPPGGDKESQGRGGSGNTYSPFLAKKNMVFMAQNNVSNRPLGSTRSPRPIAGSCATPPSSEPPFNSMEFERSLLRGKGFSENLISTLQKSRKPITIKAYGRTWRKFLSSSGAKVQDGIQMDKILEFLQRGLEQGLATNTLRVQVAALGALYNQEVASDPWVSRFMRAAARSRPIATQKVPSWDLNLVLSALTGPPFEPIQSAPLKTLSLKTILLVALTSARRVSDIQALSALPPFIKIMEDRIILKPDPAYLPKVATHFHRSQEVVLPSFCPNPTNRGEEKFHTLDVKRCLVHYLEATKGCRKEGSLFVCFQGPRKGLGASKSTLARWIRDAIAWHTHAAGIPSRRV